MKHKIFTLFLALAASIGMLKAEVYEGDCSDYVKWSYDTETKTLTISGTAEVYAEGEIAPWVMFSDYDIKQNVEHVVIEQGINSIGDYTFYYHTKLQTLEIPASVFLIGNSIVAGCSNLWKISCKGSIPPELGDYSFGGGNKKWILYIPKGCRDAYSSWEGYFGVIEESDFPSIIRTQLPDTTVCPGAMVQRIGGGEEYQYYYTDVQTETFKSYQGYDSIVTRKIIVNNIVYPYVEVKDVEGSLNSGWIRIYDTYKYYSEGEVVRANYDYFTINGVRYNHKPNASETPVDVNESYKTPSFILENLPHGTYTIKFFIEDCQLSDEVSYTINLQRIKVGDLYYNFYTSWESGKEITCAEVTYKGIEYSYSNYSDSKIVIPEEIQIEDNTYPVKKIGSQAFYNCKYLTSVIIPSGITNIEYYAFNSCSNLTEIILYPKIVPTLYNKYVFDGVPSNAVYRVPVGSYSYYANNYYWKYLNIQPAVNVTHSVGPTNCTLQFESIMDEITACGVKDGEITEGTTLEYIGLEPNRTYSNVEFVVYTADNDSAICKVSFTTEALKLTTLESKATSNTTAILLAETNIGEQETNCGFEWKRYEAPSDMKAKKEYVNVKNGMMAGRLKGLQSDVYYKYRAFYQTMNGSMYYGEWQYIFTGDAGVEFEPILYTESATAVKENEATLRGFALAGSEEITEQGFEYWVDSRVDVASTDAFRAQARENTRYTVEAEGIAMEVTLTSLDPGTLYKFRAYAKAGGQTFYGAELSFITKGTYTGEMDPTGINEVEKQETSTKILRNGQILILRGDMTYTLTGQEVR